MARFGSLDTQYFDDAGNPLVSGKIYFYETGTTTPKNTYADPSYAIPNANPVILTAAGRQPNIFFDGVAKAILTKSDDTQVLVRDPVGDTASTFGSPWVASKNYNANDVVQGSDGEFYVSLINGNVNNNPVTTSGSWTFLYSVEWNAGTTYKVGSVVTYDAIVYQSLQNANLNQNPSTQTAFWTPIQLSWISTQTYAIHNNVVGPDGILYTSLQNANTGNTPASSPSWWVGTSTAAAASAVAAAASAAAALVSENAAAASEVAALASENAAAADAAAAAASAAAAAVASGVSAWVSGQAYVTGNVVYSPINFQSYRATTNTSGTTDPSLSANWVFISGNVNTIATQILTNKTLNGVVLNDGYTEEVFAVTGTTPALSPTNGSIQTWTLSANSTPTAGTWAAGQSITLMIDDGTAYSVTWSSVAVTWKTDSGNAPTLNTTGFTVIQLWKVGTTIYGARVGNA